MPLLKVLVVDDDLIYRKILCYAVGATDLAHSVHNASNGEIALERIRNNQYDVILVDVFMPGMNGLELLRVIKNEQPELAVIVISGGSNESGQLTIEALESGAFDFIVKPTEDTQEKNMAVLKNLLTTLFAELGSKPGQRSDEGFSRLAKDQQLLRQLPDKAVVKKQFGRAELVVIAVSTGGPVALKNILKLIPSDMSKPILVVQHMPPGFTKIMADSLNKISNIKVMEAKEGAILADRTVYIAPGGEHMTLNRVNPREVAIKLIDGQAVNGVKPSADVFFTSVAQAYPGTAVLAVVLTGMGRDGVEGVRLLKEKCNCHCIVQSEQTCVVFGMPRAVIEAELADEVTDMDYIAGRISELSRVQ